MGIAKDFFKRGRILTSVLDNGKTGDEREELEICSFQGEDKDWFIALTLKMPKHTYSYIDFGFEHIDPENVGAWTKMVRMAIRGLIMDKLGVREPMTFLRSKDRAWMDNVEDSMFSGGKWRKTS